ncbi:LacI family transcriptional regulator [Micromonospora sp. DR5-3]|uniref:LacI family DNA-binding transcriptional regulator n=1 Tax=unclassified Micromonospora TaxID=2617518 RepID=UPI0011DB104C|nr:MULTISPECIES: LacI family DNA-binding transcriptional regulator [unclassified Micromonospora]MCW3816434.1 LacI family transcriptional regulator [Micromonospora sp. DR5-3]TYC21513.1 LacI family transcriptional regulator [Micromonospora sp. MP36]
MRATIREVAREAGVSASTVSRALSTPEMVNAATRERVLRAAERLGYAPNRAARGLITGRTGNLGLIVPDLTNPFFPSVVKGVQAKAREADYAVFLADTDEDPAAEIGLVRVLAKQVDGLILCSPRAREEEIRELTEHTTLVMVNRRFGNLPSVVFDNAEGIRQAIAHLQALGHQRVAWVGGPRTSWSTRDRMRALRAATGAAGMELYVAGHFPPYFEGGVAAADLVIASGVTSVIAYNDVMALGLLSRLRDRGVDVPGDISVIGIDNIQMSAMSSPALTTVSLTKEQAGRAAVDLLLALLLQPDSVRNTRRELPAQLLVRGSTGVARTT